jgi:microcystin degradation protein MlrC
MVKVAFGGISHETNTFATRALGLTSYESFRPITGDKIVSATGKLYMGGMCDAARELDYECVGLLYGITEPSGTIADSAFESMRDELVSRLKDAMPVDAVALEVHGAGVAESYEDIEGNLVLEIRKVVGPDVPIVGVFDLHGNISNECAATFDFMCPVWVSKWYPVVDGIITFFSIMPIDHAPPPPPPQRSIIPTPTRMSEGLRWCA